jgi:hypothetical protein
VHNLKNIAFYHAQYRQAVDVPTWLVFEHFKGIVSPYGLVFLAFLHNSKLWYLTLKMFFRVERKRTKMYFHKTLYTLLIILGVSFIAV